MKAITLLALAASLLLAGCTQSGHPSVPEQDEQGRYVIHMTASNRFSPGEAEVPVGATVVWVTDGGVHDVTSKDGTFRSEDRTLSVGESYSFTFAEEGTYPYQCDLHQSQGMKGTIHVGDHEDH